VLEANTLSLIALIPHKRVGVIYLKKFWMVIARSNSIVVEYDLRVIAKGSDRGTSSILVWTRFLLFFDVRLSIYRVIFFFE
jgi:hypothetical protein